MLLPQVEDQPTLRDYQMVDLAFMISQRRSLILHDPGGGKTPPVCVWIYHKWISHGEKTIWVQPKSLMRKNRLELLRFSHFTEDDVYIVDGPGPWPDAKVYLMGPARFKTAWKTLWEDDKSINNVVGDEVHTYWSTDTSAASKSIYAAMEVMNGFVGMTGSWIKGRLSSAYPMIHVIEPRYYASYKSFLGTHAVYSDDGDIVGWKATNKIGEIASRHAIRRSFESIYGPESKIVVTELAEMNVKQREAYDEFKDKAIIELDDAFLEGQGGVHALRCRQIMSHPETFGLAKGEMTGKDELLDIHLEDHKLSGEPCVVFASFMAEQERIVRLIRSKGLTVALLNGSVDAKKRAQIDEDFRSGKIQFIVGSPAVATVGYNWDHCGHVIFASLDYEDSTFYQAYRRCIRGKRSTPLLINILEYSNSIDQRIMSIIKRKSTLASAIDGREIFDLSAT